MFQWDLATIYWSYNDKITSGAWCCCMKETTTFTFFVICFAHVVFPNLPIASLDNEQHKLENKDLKNDRLEGQLHFSCSKHCMYKFVQCCRLQWFRCIHPMHYICNGHPSFPNCVNGTYEYIATWTNKHYVQQWTLCNVVPTIRTNGCSIFVNQISCSLSYLFGHIHLGLFQQICVQSIVWQGFVVGSRFGGCFHNFYEHQVSHNIEGDARFINESCPLLVQILFLAEFNPLGNETCQKVQVLLFVD